MKKLFTLLAFLTVCTFAQAQELGIRFGDVLGNNVAIDGLFNAGKFSRIHANVSFGNDGVGIEALWDFLYRPLGNEAFNWYVGVGPSLGIFDPFVLGVSGEAGLEYTFNTVPISLSLDWRPTFVIVENTDFWAGGFGFNVRYVFNKK
ncbi:MAG: outer membrane insertion C- signal [Cyclobacteriaceae bacterium]|jgi:hypothetical protein|nr:outer membrane insertion C- signal [Cyclobacteriaceae bacterium]